MPLPQVDFFLAALLEEFANGVLSMDITLMINGMLVSGRPIPKAVYFEELRTQVLQANESAANRGPLPDSPAEAIDTMITELAGLSMDTVDGYVTLKNVSVLGGDGKITPAELWRGRLTEVVGWNLGCLEQRP